MFQSDPTLPNPAIKDIKGRRKARQESEFEEVHESLDPPTRRLIDCACKQGALAWLSALPVEEHGFCCNKGSLRDA